MNFKFGAFDCIHYLKCKQSKTPRNVYFFFSNPFAFNRSWEVTTTSNSDCVSFVDETSKLEKLVAARFDNFERQFSTFFSTIAAKKTKGKGRGKGKKSQNDQVAGPSNEAMQRMNDFIENAASGVASASSSRTSIRSNQRRDVDVESDLFTEDREPLTTKKKIYIKKVDCQLNANSIDQVDDKANVDECMQMFWRMYKFNGQVICLFIF